MLYSDILNLYMHNNFILLKKYRQENKYVLSLKSNRYPNINLNSSYPIISDGCVRVNTDRGEESMQASPRPSAIHQFVNLC